MHPPAPREARGCPSSLGGRSTWALGKLSGGECPAQNSQEHLPSHKWQQLPRCLPEREAQRCLLWDFMALRLCGGDCISDGCSGARGQGLTHLPAPSPPVDRSQTVESVLCCQTASVNRTRGQPWQHLSLIRDFHRGSRSGLAATQGCLAIAQVLSSGSQGFIKGHCQRDQA